MNPAPARMAALAMAAAVCRRVAIVLIRRVPFAQAAYEGFGSRDAGARLAGFASRYHAVVAARASSSGVAWAPNAVRNAVSSTPQRSRNWERVCRDSRIAG